MTKDIDLSEELMQETFYCAIKSINKFNYECKISVWLCQIAKNKFKDELRKRSKREIIFLEEYPDELLENIYENIDNNLILKEEKEILYKLLGDMTEPIKELFYLRITLDLPFKDIAQIIGRTEEWARVNFYRTKIKLKEELENNE